MTLGFRIELGINNSDLNENTSRSSQKCCFLNRSQLTMKDPGKRRLFNDGPHVTY